MSTCTRRVGLIAKERNVPYEVVTVKLMEAEHKQPPFLEHQPFGQIPYIVVRRRFPSGVFLLCAFCSFLWFLSNFYLFSKTMALSCSSRAPSDGTSRRLARAHSWSLPSPRRTPSTSRRQASSIRSLIRSCRASPGRKFSSRASGRLRMRSVWRSSSLSLRASLMGTRPSWGSRSTSLVMCVPRSEHTPLPFAWVCLGSDTSAGGHPRRSVPFAVW